MAVIFLFSLEPVEIFVYGIIMAMKPIHQYSIEHHPRVLHAYGHLAILVTLDIDHHGFEEPDTSEITLCTKHYTSTCAVLPFLTQRQVYGIL